jgi:hypothetical protein
VQPIEKGGFTLNGHDLSFGHSLALDTGSFALTGYDAQVLAHYVQLLEPGSFDLTGYVLILSNVENTITLAARSTISDLQGVSTITDISERSTVTDILVESEL